MKKFLYLIFLTTLSSSLLSQSTSSDTIPFHSPRKASILSAIAPGAGQIYNKKYWKLPIIYGGIGLSIYYLDDNLKNIKYYKQNLIAIQDDDPNTVNETNFTSGNLNDLIDRYKKLRDLSYISIGAIYALQILDANVDANLWYFDVHEDLSFSILPYMDTSAKPYASCRIAFNF